MVWALRADRSVACCTPPPDKPSNLSCGQGRLLRKALSCAGAYCAGRRFPDVAIYKERRRADGLFVDLVNLRVPGMGLMGLAPEWAGKARHHTRFNAHPV